MLKFTAIALFAFLSLAGNLCAESAEIAIPRQEDWAEQGIAVHPGPQGAWDLGLIGAISPGAVIKKDGRYFLYYIGADGRRSTDQGPRHRAIGVATSVDGIHFAKYADNPVITFLPHRNEEEGIFSVAAMIDDDGTILLYYGAMDAGNRYSESVSGDIRLATSTDGYKFTDQGIVLSHSDRNVWGYGDEIFPVGAFRNGNKFYVFYIVANGMGIKWGLGLAWGPDRNTFSDTQEVIRDGPLIIGGGDVIMLGKDRIALFLLRTTDWDSGVLEAMAAPVDSPSRLGLVEKYDAFGHTSIYLDKDTGTWFMYYGLGQNNEIRVKTAAMSK